MDIYPFPVTRSICLCCLIHTPPARSSFESLELAHLPTSTPTHTVSLGIRVHTRELLLVIVDQSVAPSSRSFRPVTTAIRHLTAAAAAPVAPDLYAG